MISFDKNDNLLIDGKRVRQHNPKHYIVSYERIRREDLSNVPLGTKFRVTDQPETEFSIVEIEVITFSKVAVFVDWNHWDHKTHALDDLIYRDIGEALLTKTGRIGYHHFDDVTGHSTKMMFTTEVPNGTVQEIQDSVSHLMLHVVEPLSDARDQIDDDLRHRFDCCKSMLH